MGVAKCVGWCGGGGSVQYSTVVSEQHRRHEATGSSRLADDDARLLPPAQVQTLRLVLSILPLAIINIVHSLTSG